MLPKMIDPLSCVVQTKTELFKGSVAELLYCIALWYTAVAIVHSRRTYLHRHGIVALQGLLLEKPDRRAGDKHSAVITRTDLSLPTTSSLICHKT